MVFEELAIFLENGKDAGLLLCQKRRKQRLETGLAVGP